MRLSVISWDKEVTGYDLPFENDTSAIVKKLASRSIKADKRRNVFIIVTIAFAVCLMTILALYNTANQAKWKEEERDHYQAAIVAADEQVLDVK